MAKPTLQNVYDKIRSALGADAAGGSAVYSNTVLELHFAEAYRCLFRTMALLGNPYVERDVYFVLPTNTSFLDPVTAGITDFGEPRFVEERGNLTQKTITGASGTSTVSITAAAHGFNTGDEVTCNGIVGFSGTEGTLWSITVTDANVFALNGCIGSGTYISGGVAVKSGEEFVPLTATDRLDAGTSSAELGRYTWQGDVFRFNPSTEARQLRITYTASGAAPTSTSTVIGIDDSIDFLATYAAGLAARSRGADSKADRLMRRALGPTMEEDASGGLLRSFLAATVRSYQRNPTEERRRLPFRDSRSNTQHVF